jgi:hypothetical protein
MSTVFETGKATLYKTSEFGFGYGKIEVKSIKVEACRYAQYDHAYRVTYVPKGARKPRQFYSYGGVYNPVVNGRFVILNGWGSFDLTDWIDRDIDGSGLSRHMSCDPAWDQEFDDALRASGEPLAFDGRTLRRVAA